MSYPSDDITFRQLQRFMDSIQHNWPANTKSILYRAAELMGEAGEVGEKCKKVHRDRDGQPNAEDLAGIKKELGDVAICLVNLASQVGLDIEDVIEACMQKMRNRIATKTVQGSGDDREVVQPAITELRAAPTYPDVPYEKTLMARIFPEMPSPACAAVKPLRSSREVAERFQIATNPFSTVFELYCRRDDGVQVKVDLEVLLDRINEMPLPKERP